MSAQQFPTNLKFLRRREKLTQEKFSSKIGLPLKRYAKWEEGCCQPDIDSLINIAKVHQVTLDELLTEDLTNNFSK